MKSVEIYFHSIREDVERLLKRKKEKKEGVENGRITVRLRSRLVLQKEKVGKMKESMANHISEGSVAQVCNSRLVQ